MPETEKECPIRVVTLPSCNNIATVRVNRSYINSVPIILTATTAASYLKPFYQKSSRTANKSVEKSPFQLLLGVDECQVEFKNCNVV